MDKDIFDKLRGCFIAGYTVPQFCIDEGIKKPLFVAEKVSVSFIKELHLQFKCDKRLLPQFCFIDSDTETVTLPIKHVALISARVTVTDISKVKFNDFDGIILLTKQQYDIDFKRVIRFTDFEDVFYRRTYVDIPLLNFLQRYPKVKLFLINFPGIGHFKGGNEFNSQLWDYNELRRTLAKNIQENVNMDTPFDNLGYTNSQVASLLKGTRVITHPDGSTTLSDDNDPLIRVQDGKRLTAYQPEEYLNKIYIVGTCHYYGTNAPFDKTIASYLQKMLNEANLPYRVENEGQCYWSRHQDMFYNLNKLQPAPGDIIFIYINSMRSTNNNIPFFDVSDAFDPPHDYKEVYCRRGHVNELGYKLIAEKCFKFLTENNFFKDHEINYPPPSIPYFHRYGIPPWCEQGGVKNFSNAELEQYKQTLRAKKIPIGAIVMNCNPFTLGHRYLVEYAAAKVARLYIFVVEEDRSEFPFVDRFELVKQGVKDIPNVEVIPSGKFIISQTTFSGYFNKASLQDVTVDSSEDVEIFAQEIAPTLGITVRFAGEEPKDNVTRQYNETMKRILPRYGIEFHEIPRKTLGDEVISASYVREALKIGDFDKIQQLVPETTLKYLRRRFSLREAVKCDDFDKFKELMPDATIDYFREQRTEFLREAVKSDDFDKFKELMPDATIEYFREQRTEFLREAVKSDDFDKFKELMPDATIEYFREQRTEFLRHITARIDIKLLSTEGDFQVVNVSDGKANVYKPTWFNKDGVGYQIQSCAEKLELVVKATVEGKILLALRGLDIRTPEDKSKRIPYWIDYTKLTINGKVIFDTVTPAWHDKPYRHNIDAKADEEIKIQLEWQAHNN